jgi:hypothetical protein
MVNQEKIIGLVYYYVALTGDRAFLDEIINGKTILDLMVEHATVLEDLSKPVALIDYGPSNSHLELRKSLPYNHVMPDLNGRRYMNYMRTVELCHFAGKPRPDLATRAEDLKDLLKRELWSPEPRWFKFRDDAGKEDVRYTVQIFKLFGSGVLNDDQTQGLLSHLNENEFLSEHGLHSLAKQDPAYDPADVDNGGPGACTSFPPQIAERLYRSGQYSAADDIIRRILWWGKHTPYWGDSMVAERIDYRKDTPLQCTVDGVAVAQSIIFGMFGVEVGLDGQVTVRPHCPHFVGKMSLTGLKIRGNVYDIVVHQNGPANVLNKSKGLSKDIPLNVRTRIDE